MKGRLDQKIRRSTKRNSKTLVFRLSCKVVDGFGSHVNAFRASQIWNDEKKEEGDSLHVNQAYDMFIVVKGDKAVVLSTSLSYLRQAKQMTHGIINQRKLIHLHLTAARSTTPETRTRSF
jgi:hypothetical protein